MNDALLRWLQCRSGDGDHVLQLLKMLGGFTFPGLDALRGDLELVEPPDRRCRLGWRRPIKHRDKPVWQPARPLGAAVEPGVAVVIVDQN